MRKAQLAINSVSTTQKSLAEALAAYVGAGFRNVEFVLPLLTDWLTQEGRSLEDAQALLAQHKLRSIGGFQTHVQCFGAAEELHANHELHLTNARLIHALGGGTLVVGTDGPGQTLEALDTIAEVLSGLVKQFEGLNVKLALEFNWSPSVKSFKSALYVVKKVNHPQLGILFDPAHYYTTVSKFEDLTAETVPWIAHCHFNDMRDKPGDVSNCNSDRVLPGQGILALNALVARLEQCGYNGYFSIEMFNADLWQLPALEAAQQCYQSLLPFCED